MASPNPGTRQSTFVTSTNCIASLKSNAKSAFTKVSFDAVGGKAQTTAIVASISSTIAAPVASSVATIIATTVAQSCSVGDASFIAEAMTVSSESSDVGGNYGSLEANSAVSAIASSVTSSVTSSVAVPETNAGAVACKTIRCQAVAVHNADSTIDGSNGTQSATKTRSYQATSSSATCSEGANITEDGVAHSDHGLNGVRHSGYGLLHVANNGLGHVADADNGLLDVRDGLDRSHFNVTYDAVGTGKLHSDCMATY